MPSVLKYLVRKTGKVFFKICHCTLYSLIKDNIIEYSIHKTFVRKPVYLVLVDKKIFGKHLSFKSFLIKFHINIY